MSEKVYETNNKSWFRRHPIITGIVGFILLSGVAGTLFGDTELDSPDTVSVVQNIIEDIPVEVTDHDSNTLGTFTIDGDDTLFDGYSDPRVELWDSEAPDTLSDSRELVKKLERGTEVKLLQKDAGAWYCEVSHGGDTGWLACEWLQPTSVQETAPQAAETAHSATYTVLREWNPNQSNRLGLEVVLEKPVTNTSSLESFIYQVSEKYPAINILKIYTSEEAWAQEQAGEYTDVYGSDYIAYVTYREEIEIRWMQETGIFAGNFGMTTELDR